MTIEVKEKTPVMISGTGKMGRLVAERIIRSDDFRLHGFAFQGKRQRRKRSGVAGQEIRPARRCQTDLL